MLSNGIITLDTVARATTLVGNTPSPCHISLGASAAPETSSDSGKGGLTPTQTGVFLLAEGRLGSQGQHINLLSNGHSTPWMWSVIKFSSTGAPIYNNQQPFPGNFPGQFPTYSVYINGVRKDVYPQSSAASFIARDATYQLSPAQVQ
jgi:hypothetical protein